MPYKNKETRAAKGREYSRKHYRKDVTHGREVARRCQMKKRIRETGMTECGICGKPVEDHGFHSHHVRYNPERVVLLCAVCHGWLHGSMRIYRHPFKDKYGQDLGPFVFASKVVDLYMEHDARFQETVEIKLKDLTSDSVFIALNEYKATDL